MIVQRENAHAKTFLSQFRLMLQVFGLKYTAISINVDRMVPWVFTGICIEALRKSTSLYFCTWSVSVFLSLRCFLYLSIRRYVVGIILLKVHAAKKDISFTCLKRKETQKVSLLYCYISLVFSTCGPLYLRPYYLLVLSLSFKLQSDNVN